MAHMCEWIGWRAKLREAEESDVLLCAGLEALFFGSYLIYQPAAYLLTGLAFIGLAYLATPRQGVAHGVA